MSLESLLQSFCPARCNRRSGQFWRNSIEVADICNSLYSGKQIRCMFDRSRLAMAICLGSINPQNLIPHIVNFKKELCLNHAYRAIGYENAGAIAESQMGSEDTNALRDGMTRSCWATCVIEWEGSTGNIT